MANDNVNFVLIGRWHYFGFVFLRHSMKTALINEDEPNGEATLENNANARKPKGWPSLVSPWVSLIISLNAGLHGTIFARGHNMHFF